MRPGGRLVLRVYGRHLLYQAFAKAYPGDPGPTVIARDLSTRVLRGDRGIARSSASILHTSGTLELIADTMDRYVELNVRLALDPGRRVPFRAELRQRLMRSALMNMNAFVADLEAAYRGMWTSWRTSQTRRR